MPNFTRVDGANDFGAKDWSNVNVNKARVKKLWDDMAANMNELEKEIKRIQNEAKANLTTLQGIVDKAENGEVTGNIVASVLKTGKNAKDRITALNTDAGSTIKDFFNIHKNFRESGNWQQGNTPPSVVPTLNKIRTEHSNRTKVSATTVKKLSDDYVVRSSALYKQLTVLCGQATSTAEIQKKCASLLEKLKNLNLNCDTETNKLRGKFKSILTFIEQKKDGLVQGAYKDIEKSQKLVKAHVKTAKQLNDAIGKMWGAVRQPVIGLRSAPPDEAKEQLTAIDANCKEIVVLYKDCEKKVKKHKDYAKQFPQLEKF